MIELFQTLEPDIAELEEKIRLANEAQQQYMQFTQQQVDKIVKAVADAAFEKADYLAQLAVKETGMGVIAHKKMKNEVSSRDVYNDIKSLKTVGVIHEDRMKKVVEIASPFGVVAAIIPTTNPTSTAIFKALICLKTRNALVASPHPYAVNCTEEALAICHEAALQAGAPEGIIQCLTHSSMEATRRLIKHTDIHLILATGGGAMVRAAYSSGKPAYGVGPGNVPVYIEKSAKIESAVKMVVTSKSFDYGTICATEQALVVDREIFDQVVKKLKQQDAYFLNDEEKAKLEKIISLEIGKVNSGIVGRSPQQIAQLAGIHIPETTKIIVGYESEVGKEVPFSLEKLSPILALYKADSIAHAKELCNRLLDLGGRGHTLAIHTERNEIARQFSIDLPASRIVVNTMAALGAVGGTTNLRPSFTLGCGTFGGNITSDNISAEHLLVKKRMAYGVKEVKVSPPPIEQIQREVQQVSITAMDTVDDELIAKIVQEVLKNLKQSN